MRNRFRDPREQVRGRKGREEFQRQLEREAAELQRRRRAERVLGLGRPDRLQAIISQASDDAVDHAMAAAPDGKAVDGLNDVAAPEVDAFDLAEVCDGIDPCDDVFDDVFE